MDDKEVERRYIDRLGVLEDRAKMLAEATERALSKAMLDKLIYVDRISFRVKDPVSYLKKAFRLKDLKDPNSPRKYEDPLQEIEDQVAGRVLVLLWSDLVHVEKILTEYFWTSGITRRAEQRASEFAYERTITFLRCQAFLVPHHGSSSKACEASSLGSPTFVDARMGGNLEYNLNYRAKVELQ